jgi:PAS domain S-box-containing protein
MLGYEAQEFEATFEKGLEIIHTQDRKRSTALLEDVLQNDVEYFIEKRLIAKAGNIVHVRSKATVFKDEKGSPIKLIGVFQDISDFVISEKQLLEQNSLTQDIIRNLPAAFFLFNQDGKLLLWNEQVYEITGYHHEELAAKAVVDLFEGEEKIKIVRHVEEALTEGYTELEAWLTNSIGEKVPLYFTASTIQYKGEQCVFGIGTDISERLSLLHELQLLTDNTEEAFAYLDEKLNIVSFNQQMRVHSELLFQKELKKGMKIIHFAKPGQKDDLNKILKEVWKKKEVKEK